MAAALAAGRVALAFQLPLIYLLLHFCYGAGFIFGLIAPRYRGTTAGGEVVLRRIRDFPTDIGEPSATSGDMA
jgi:ABC-type polysaccharide/polyol phosphate export permease